MESRRVNPVVVLEQLPVSVLESLRQRSSYRHSSSEVPCDVIRPADVDSQLPSAMLRIDGLLLGPGGLCQVLDVWLPEPHSHVKDEVKPEPEKSDWSNHEVAPPYVTEQHASHTSCSASAANREDQPDTDRKPHREDEHLICCPIYTCTRLVSSVKTHLLKDHRISKKALRHVMARLS